MNYLNQIEEAKKYIEKRTSLKPEIGLILGSGLGILGNEIENPSIIKYENIPYFTTSTIEGHAGQLVIGKLNKKNVIAMQGRIHYYEGYSMEQITFPIRVMKALGVKTLIITNAAGGVNRKYNPGDLMIIKDHINFGFDNPLIGENFNELGVRFPDMSNAYSKRLIKITKEVSQQIDLDIKEGTYMFQTGPTYETPAEIRLASILGADAVGMSTVPEAIVATHSNIEVLGISCITNMASGILDKPLNHIEVIETAEKVKLSFINLIKNILMKM